MKGGDEALGRRQLTIAERQKRLNRVCKIAEYLIPIIVSSAVTAIVCIMVFR